MIDGYEVLNENINQTIVLISDVSKASQEQKYGIEQINDAVTQLDQATQENASSASAISSLATGIQNLSSRLIDITAHAKYDNKANTQVCDIDMMYYLNALKLDHIKFKDTNFAKLASKTTWSVVDHHSCRLGKWIDEQENTNKVFTKNQNWTHLKEVHKQVHTKVQGCVNVNAKNDDSLISQVKSLEKDISDVFWTIQQVKRDNCQ
jgi:methyl-accepting chemotaxis protein